ncbi:hypothetical protein RYA07_10965, partial [Pseudomonas syringae pv. actinidiae]|nr:hypothetical protein [Pseudomonas syringae pv. actinidiae]
GRYLGRSFLCLQRCNQRASIDDFTEYLFLRQYTSHVIVAARQLIRFQQLFANLPLNLLAAQKIGGDQSLVFPDKLPDLTQSRDALGQV